jgi:acyl-CoA reductase-like NAD-dependent aldehyde dehydrogenase
MTSVAHIGDLLSANMIIGDTRSPTGSGGTYDHVNPSTGQVQAQVPLAGEAEVEAAVSAARAAFLTWKTWNPAERRLVLARLAELLKQNGEKFVSIQALETGIPISTGGVLGMLVDWAEYAASCADKLAGEVIPTQPGSQFDYTLLEPIGVVGVLIPWNGPVGQIGISVMAPLAAGCCVVVKPSELAPHDRIYDEYVGRLATAMTALRVGNASEAGTQMGPLINQAIAAASWALSTGQGFGRQPRGRRSGHRRRRLLHAANPVRRCRQLERDRAAGDLRAGARSDPLPRRGRGHRARC